MQNILFAPTLRALFITLLGNLLFHHAIIAQSYWSPISEGEIPPLGIKYHAPKVYGTYALDVEGLQAQLAEATATPEWESGDEVAVIALPMPDGSILHYRLQSSGTMHPDLGKHYPEIMSFRGNGVEHPYQQVRCDMTPKGFFAMITSDRASTIYIDPYTLAHTAHYIVYSREEYQRVTQPAFNCWVGHDEDKKVNEIELPSENLQHGDVQERNLLQGDCKVRTYRLALACTGEYAQFHGGTKPLVLSAMVVSMNRVNGVYMKEFSVQMEIIPNDTLLIFLDPVTDGYSNTSGSTMLGQNKTKVNALIGAANYDIGHVYSTGGGGIAEYASVCGSDKARGVTGSDTPIGDAFDIDYVAHEMGHQFSGSHSYYNSCSGNKVQATAMEPGSGSTIMGYAGICAPDVQNHSDDYFASVNLAEMGNFIYTGNGNGCAVITDTPNEVPTANAGANYIIPKSTPFFLTAQGSDVNGDSLTYNWEQYDNLGNLTQPPAATNAQGPLFRSRKSLTSPIRYFPLLQNVVNNSNNTWEVLPSVARNMKFTVTVRDNKVDGGCLAIDEMQVTVNGNSGPFRVTQPNTVITWVVGSYQQITWDVANTNNAPVSSTNVEIHLSVDGGFTYPFILETLTTNDGSHYVLVPDTLTTKARVRVKGAGNIFYDISNVNFKIEAPTTPTFSMAIPTDNSQVCLPNNFTTAINTVGLGGFNSPVELSVTGNLPSGAVANIIPSTINAGENAQLTVNMQNANEEGTFLLQVRAIVGLDTITRPVTISTVSNDYSNMALVIPPDGSIGYTQSPSFTWSGSADANAYDFQLASSPSFAPATILLNLENTTVTNANVTSLLEKGKVYYWRVRPSNQCGKGAWLTPYAFSTFKDVCSIAQANDLPKNISANNTTTVESISNINVAGIISDVNINGLQIYHDFYRDLRITLVSPSGTEVTIYDHNCGNFSGQMNMDIDDSALNPFPCPPANNGNAYRPVQPLTAFNGQDALGTWKLIVRDTLAGSGGTFQAWELEVCASSTVVGPVLLTNSPLVVSAGLNYGISSTLLKATDADNTDDEIIFTLSTVPAHGDLRRFFEPTVLQPGDTFTQTDLNNGVIRYFDYGSFLPTDEFKFTITDGEGGFTGTHTFVINLDPLGTDDHTPALDFSVYPNPTGDKAFVRFSDGAKNQTLQQISLINVAGQTVWSDQAANYVEVYEVNVAHLPSGVYFLKAETDQAIGIKKIIKN